MATKQNGTVQVEGIDPDATEVPTTIKAIPYGGTTKEEIGAYFDGNTWALAVVDFATESQLVSTNNILSNIESLNTNIEDNTSNSSDKLTTIASDTIGLSVFKSNSERGSNFAFYSTTGANISTLGSTFMTYLNSTNPTYKVHSYMIVPIDATNTTFSFTALLVLP